jgi:DNA-binding CsgD family transcriptional regulator
MALATMPKTRPRAPGPRSSQAAGGLTARERDVARLIAAGKTNREIANELFIGEGTVATHVKSILQKLDFRSRSQIAAWIIATDIEPPSPTAST